MQELNFVRNTKNYFQFEKDASHIYSQLHKTREKSRGYAFQYLNDPVLTKVVETIFPRKSLYKYKNSKRIRCTSLVHRFRFVRKVEMLGVIFAYVALRQCTSVANRPTFEEYRNSDVWCQAKLVYLELRNEFILLIQQFQQQVEAEKNMINLKFLGENLRFRYADFHRYTEESDVGKLTLSLNIEAFMIAYLSELYDFNHIILRHFKKAERKLVLTEYHTNRKCTYEVANRRHSYLYPDIRFCHGLNDI